MKIKEGKWHILFLFIIGVQIFPLIYMLSISFKSMEQIFSAPLSLIPKTITFKNYSYIVDNVEILRYLWNTFFIATIVTGGKIITSILAGYVLAFKSFKGKKILKFVFLATLFVPFTVTMIPNYLMISEIGLLNSSLGVIIPQLADGMGILFFINSWNEYFWPLLILSDKKNYTLSLALQMFISAEGGNDLGVTMAIATLTIIFPIFIYIFFQKKIMTSFTKSGIKG